MDGAWRPAQLEWITDKAGIAFSSLWRKDFNNAFILNGLVEWLSTGSISHVRDFELSRLPKGLSRLARQMADAFATAKLLRGFSRKAV